MKLSIENFVAVVQKSGLVENDRLQNAVARLSAQIADGIPNAAQLAELLVAENQVTKWQAEKLFQGKHRGYFLGKYKLLSLLGKGGMSSVYLAEHRVMRRQCALKVLPAKRVDDSSYLERFHREAQAAASLDHPNIVRAYDVDHQEEGDRQIHFLVMEYVEGSSLQDLVPEKGLASFLDAAEYARQAALGLQHAHENGMVHRDIKPGNLLVDLNGVVKILDLGLARFFKIDEGKLALTLRHDEKVLGTADYLSPEQALDSHTVDSRADLYSLGCTFYFMITGRPPFTEGSLAQRLLAHQVKTPAAIESIRTDVPPALAAIIRKMMEKKPADRYSTAAEVEKTLHDWIDQNADNRWRNAHFKDFGRRASDSDTKMEALPVAKPVEAPAKVAEARISSTANGVSSDVLIESPVSLQNLDGSTAPIVTSDTSLNQFLSTLAEPKPAPPKPASVPGVRATVTEAIAPKPVPLEEAMTKILSSSGDMPVWDSLSTTNSSMDSNPIHNPDPHPTAIQRKYANRKGRNRKTLFTTIAAGLALALFGLYALSGSWGQKTQVGRNSIQSPFPPEKLEVTVGGMSGEYKGIRDALIAVRDRYRPGLQSTKVMTIKVAAGAYTDRIRIDGRSQPWPEGIRVVGDGVVRLAPTGEDPVIRLANVSRFSMENIQVDASNRKVAIELAGDLHETRLSQMVLTGFTEIGIDCKGTQGLSFSNSQLQIERIRFEPAGASATGIRIGPSSEHDANNIVIRSCRFLDPMAAGIVIQGHSPYGIDIAQSLFNEIHEGIRFEGELQLKLIRVVNNSFRRCKFGVFFSQSPHELSAELVFRRNLFLETGMAEAAVNPAFDEVKFRPMIASSPNGIQDNWSDRPKSASPIQGEILIFFENQGRQGEKNLNISSVDPKDPKFLAPTEKSPHRDVAGAQGIDKKWIGAIGPQ